MSPIHLPAWGILILIACVACTAGAASAADAAQATPAVGPVQRQDDGITLPVDGGTLRLQVWSDRVIRVQFAAGKTIPITHSFAVITSPQPTQWDHHETGDSEVLTTPLLHAEINRHTGAVRFTDAAGKLLLAEVGPDGRSFTTSPAGQNLTQVQQQFLLPSREHIYGLGQHQLGMMSYRGSVVHLRQANTDVAVPVLISSNGYGIFWDNPSTTDVAVVIPSASGRLTFTSQVGQAIDYFFMAGPAIDDVIAAYRQLTGAAPLLGKWAWGLWQCKERYKSQQELLDVAGRYRQMQVPIDGIIQDWQYWRPNQWGSHEFDASRYPDPVALLKQLHDEHFHALISVWPKFHLGTANEQALEKINGLYDRTFTNGWFKDQSRWYDAFNADARQLYWSQIDQHLARQGWDGWWLDASEPELSETWHDLDTLQTAAGPGAAVLNAWPLLHTTAVYQGQRRDEPDKRVFILTRSAYAGEQRNSAVIWSGDTQGTWDVLRRQIAGGLNFSVSGIPYWNTDIGGFYGGDPKDPDYAELFTRWYQFGAFCPMFRVHGTGHPKEIWQWDPATQKVLLSYDQLRYRLLPYIYSVSWQVTHDSYSMIRPLVMDFRTDPDALDVPDQYMFGPAIMVNPVYKPRAQARYVYLPKGDDGQDWYDFWTGKKSTSGTAADAAAPIQTMPLFVRAGSILPLGPIVQYTAQQPDAPLELRVYRGANGSFTLYDDEGDSYRYEHGAYATIPITWDDAAQKLTIGSRSGSYPGMPAHRQFKIVWVHDGHGSGLAEEASPDQTVDYDGTETTATPR